MMGLGTQSSRFASSTQGLPLMIYETESSALAEGDITGFGDWRNGGFGRGKKGSHITYGVEDTVPRGPQHVLTETGASPSPENTNPPNESSLYPAHSGCSPPPSVLPAAVYLGSKN